ncbi:DMT family transporter [Ottowia sp.]|uniref:DMT family transporter n=1 Tax=Ottowia sp. TaxID=1898956 RepID=UPI003A853BFD
MTTLNTAAHAPAWSHARAAWVMVLATLLWSIVGVVTRQLQAAQGFEITFWRSFFNALALLVIFPFWQGSGVFARFPWRSWAFWLSGLCWATMFTAFMVALTMTGVARVLVTMALGPLLTALLSRVATGHRLPARTWVAIVLAGVGMGWMFAGRLGEGGAAASTEWLGSVVALGVPIGAAINWTVVQRSQARGASINLVPAVLLGGVLSAAFTLPLAWPLQATAHDLAWLSLLGVMQLAVPCVLVVLAAQVLPAAEVSLLALLEVVFGILLVWWLAGEAPRPEVLQGGALVLGALLGNEWVGWRNASRDEQVPLGPA